MLEIKNLEFSYGKNKILKNVNLTLEEEIGCILGPNGAGKSTLLKTIAGILKPEKGEILVEGKNIINMDFKARAKLISYAPQEFGINFPYSVFEVILMGRNPYINPVGGPTDNDEKIVKSIINYMNLNNIEHNPFTELSSGQKRMVLIARAIAQGGKLHLFDEPTSFLDFRNQHFVLSLIQKTKKESEEILISIHDPNLALSFCDKVFLLKEGLVIDQGAPERTVNEENMLRMYNMKVKFIKIEDLKMIVPENTFMEDKIQNDLKI